MKRLLTFACKALVFAGLTGAAVAAEPVFYSASADIVVADDNAKPKPMPRDVVPAPMPPGDGAKSVKPATPAAKTDCTSTTSSTCSSCGSSECCVDCTCCEEEHLHFLAGAGFLVLKPFGNNVAWRRHLEFNEPSTGRFVSGSTDTNFNHETGFAPRIWLGVQDPCGLGGRVRWFGYDSTANTEIRNDYNSTCTGGPTENCLTLLSAAPFFGEPGFHNGTGNPGDNEAEAVSKISAGKGHSLLLSNTIKFNVFDAEATQLFNAGKWLLLTGAGIRYASVFQSYQALDFQNFPLVDFPIRKILNSGNRIYGTGPMVSLECWREIADSGVYVYAAGNGAILFCDRKIHADYNEFDFATGSNTLTQVFDRFYNDVLPVADVEVGVQYARRMENMTPFVQVGVFSMVFFDAGSATSVQGNLSLLGLNVSAGLTY